MIGSNAFVVVPVKSFHGAKRRLAPMLGMSERAGLLRAMIRDVLAAAVAVVGPQRVLVVTGDDDVAAEVREIGVGVVDDEGGRGTNAAVKIGFAAVARRGGGAVMALPGDLPGVVPAEILAWTTSSRPGCREILLTNPRRGHLRKAETPTKKSA